MTSLDTVKILGGEEFNQTDDESLVKIWRKNHGHLLDHIKNRDITYFGLHGTSQRCAKLIEEQKSTNYNFNLATFYDKQRTEERLYQMYSMSAYVSWYAQPTILIFNLEKDGKNVTMPWERLYSELNFGFTPYDNDSEIDFSKKISCMTESRLWRTDTQFIKDSKQPSMFLDFQKNYLGKIDLPEYFKEFYDNSNLNEDIRKRMIRAYILGRFCAQNILTKALRLVAGGNHGTK